MIIFNRDSYPQFSNFWPAEICLDGELWQTSEHYYQAAKFVDPAIIEQIKTARTPGKAKGLSRRPAKLIAIREDWDEVKVSVMRKAVTAKFQQHKSLRNLLISTGNEHIVEGNEHDDFWGIGTGNGKNTMGKILMSVRDALREESQ